MTLIGRKILLTNTDDSGNPTLDFPITSIECVEGGASQEDLDTTNNTLAENTTNLQAQVDNLRNEISFMGSNMTYALSSTDYMIDSYITLSNTIQIVAGVVTLNAGKMTGSFTFPKEFLSPPKVVLTVISSSSGTNASLKEAPTTTGFSVRCSIEGASIHYIALRSV